MGLFSRKECANCGGKAGIIMRQKIADGSYLCGKCLENCSEELTPADYGRMTLDAYRRHIEERSAPVEFSATIDFKNGFRDLLLADDDRKLWKNASRSKPDVFRYDQAVGCQVKIGTRKLRDDEKGSVSSAAASPAARGLIGALAGAAGVNLGGFPGLPQCRPDEKVTEMKVIVTVNHPVISEVVIQVMPYSANASDAAVNDAYQAAYNIYRFFGDIRN